MTLDVNGRETAWTDERIHLLKTMWSDGNSAGVIATELGFTRNSVIGKIHRLCLPKRLTTLSSDRERMTPAERTQRHTEYMRGYRARKATEPTPVCIDEPPAAPLHKRLLDLGPGDCRFPFGEGPITFCGHPATDGSYCRAHHEVTHNPPQTKGARKLVVLMGTHPARHQPAATGSSR